MSSNYLGRRVNQSEYDKAIQYFNQALSLDKNYTQAWINKSLALEKLGRDAEAKAVSARGEEREAKEPKW